MLNAKRHQRYVQGKCPRSCITHGQLCSTPKGIKGMSRLGLPVGDGILRLCSTPKGIKGMSRYMPRTRLRKIYRAQRQKASKVCPDSSNPLLGCQRFVLNAKRHQRYVQSHTLALAEYWQKCSTPKGIKGMSSCFCQGLSTKFLSAQRQKASKVCPGSSR